MRQDSDTPGESPILAQARKRFAVAASAEADQRRRELDVLRFDAGDQWLEEAKKQRSGQIIAGVPIPARPMLTIPKLNAPVRLVENQMRGAHLGIQVHAETEDAEDDTAEILQGLIRHIEVHSRAQIARTWAYGRSLRSGRGAYRILTKYAEFGGAEFGDQELVISRILNQGNVYLDPFAQEPDWSDGMWAFVGTFIPLDTYKQDYPNSQVSDYDSADFASLGDQAPGWFTGDGADGSAVRVMEYWVVEIAKRKRIVFADETGAEQAAWQDEVEVPKEQVTRSWDIDERSVKCYKLNGVEVLEEYECDGHYIPIVPVIADEQNIDGKRRWVGMVEPAMDAGRLFNFGVSDMVEKSVSATKAPWIIAEGQEEGHEAEWGQAATRNFPYIRYKPTTLGDHVIGPPIRNFGSADISTSIGMIEQADGYLKSVTAIHDPSLGESSNARSGTAELALQQQAEAANSNYLDQFVQISMTLEAKILLDLIPRVYDRPGRVARILGIDDEPRRVVLNAPMVTDPQTGAPRMVDERQQQTNQNVKRYDLAKGRYSVTVTVGKSYQNRMQQGADEIGQILSAAPQMWPIIGDIYFHYRDMPGHTEIADRLKKMLPPPLQEQDGGKPTPEQMEIQLQQAGQMVQQLQQQLAAATQQIQTDQAKQQAQIAIAGQKQQGELARTEMELAMQEQIARIEAETKLAIERMQVDLAAAKATYDIAKERVGVELNAKENEKARAHEAAMAAQGQASEPEGA